MKLACCQFDPQWGQPEANRAYADGLLAKYDAGQIDILLLPEMAFTGYVFHNESEIAPFLEDAETSATVTWARQQARRLQCLVLVGYPENDKGTYYNSMCCVNAQGELVTTYRKSFLYTVDENWAKEGPGFQTLDLDPFGRIGFGICMDLNPYQYKTSFDAYEFANYHLEQQSTLLLCSMAWLKSDNEQPFSTINYWATRLFPLIKHPKDVYFVACNRIGTERGSTFAGQSCVLHISDGRMTILDSLGADDQAVMIVDV